jgi:hypothetical protein
MTNFTIQTPDTQVEIRQTIRTRIPGDKMAITIPLTTSTKTTTGDESLCAGARRKHRDRICVECHAHIIVGDEHGSNCSLQLFHVFSNLDEPWENIAKADLIVAWCGSTRYVLKNRFGYATTTRYLPCKPDRVDAAYNQSPFYSRLKLKR